MSDRMFKIWVPNKATVSRYYNLDGHTPVPCTLEEWATVSEGRTSGDDPWRVGWDDINGVTVSTVFLGLDHQHHAGGPPLLFETMVFGDVEEVCERCTTWDEAVAQHAEVVDRFR